MNKRVAFQTIGCKLNFSETSTISRDFVQHGFDVVGFRELADVYVINTCTVTAKADKDCRKAVSQVKLRNPNAFIAMVGCFTQLKPDEAQSLPGVDAIFDNSEKFKIFKHLESFNKDDQPHIYHKNIDKINDFHSSYSAGERTRTFLKVQDGCDYECTYCTIPLARGKSRSGSVADTMKHARKIATTDAKEIVLTGVNIGDFGQGTDETFFDLIKALDTLDGINRLRISSIEPNLLTDEMIDYIALSRLFVPHFHIPLQSGSNEVLADMRRRYRRELFAERIAKIKSVMLDCCIGVDVIVGFPTETDGDFQQTYDFLNSLDTSYLHVFSYSERDNTKAIEFENMVTHHQKVERSKALRELSDLKQKSFNNKFIGQERKVLFEAHYDGKVQGYTDNYIKVIVNGSPKLLNEVVPVKIIKNEMEYVVGKI